VVIGTVVVAVAVVVGYAALALPLSVGGIEADNAGPIRNVLPDGSMNARKNSRFMYGDAPPAERTSTLNATDVAAGAPTAKLSGKIDTWLDEAAIIAS